MNKKKFSQIRQELYDSMHLERFDVVNPTKEVQEVIDVFAKHGFDILAPGDANFCELTPELASDIKKFDTRNRNKTKKNLMDLMGDILRDDFHVGPDTLCISNLGVVLNAGHRIEAVIQTNKPIVIMVMCVFIEPFAQMDTGSKRSLTESNSINGNFGLGENEKIASVIRSIIRYAKESGTQFISMNKLVRETLVFNRYKKIFENFHKLHLDKTTRACFSYVCFAALVNNEDENLVIEFFNRVTNKHKYIGHTLTNLDEFIRDFAVVMNNVKHDGQYLTTYVNLTKFVFISFKKYYNNESKCPDFPYIAQDGNIKQVKQLKRVNISDYKSQLWIDVSFIEGEPVNVDMKSAAKHI